MDFDTPINRIGTHCVKWDMMESLYGVSPQEGLAMWVADMEFRPPQSVQTALENMLSTGVYGYFGDDRAYLAAIQSWMAKRHDWQIETHQILTTHGLVNAVGLCLQAYTAPGDGVILMTPVYHAFARVIKAAGREVVEFDLAVNAGRYEMDFATWEAQLTGRETMLILCSPHNPGGRVWTKAELRQVADFCIKHDLILVSDEIHHDLVYPGQKHHVMANIGDDILDRLIMLTSASKTFNIAGGHTGNAIIPNEKLRAKFAGALAALGISPNSFGLHMVTAAYSDEGAEWLDQLMIYLDGNRKIFDAGIAQIPGLRSMPLDATYLSWVDFSRTGMTSAEITNRIEKIAKIAANHGGSFGHAGANYMRFNIAAPRAQIVEAVARLQDAFKDLQ